MSDSFAETSMGWTAVPAAIATSGPYTALVTSSRAATGTSVRPDAKAAFTLALNHFMAGDKLDMQTLAAELGVDRSTLFRWVGNRDTLLISILTLLADGAIKSSVEGAKGKGGKRVSGVAESYAQKIIEATYYRTFMQREAARSLRLITTKASPLQQHVVERFEQLIEQERDRGQLEHSMATHDLAYLIVRIIESFIYADLITGDEPNSAKVGEAIAHLLHAAKR